MRPHHDMETTETYLDGCVDKDNMVHLDNVILSRLRKKESLLSEIT